jgi:polyisoprenoid-binding protein YceI
MAQWKIDPAHASAEFEARHMMITKVRGGFKNVNGTIEYDPANPAAARVEAVIDVKQMVSTGIEQRDQHLQSADFLDAANYPNITFSSTKVEPYADNTRAKITGNLTIRGVTRSVVIDAELLGQQKGFEGKQLIGFSGTTKINREDFGLTWNMALETGGWLVGKDVTISLEVEAVQVAEPATV